MFALGLVDEGRQPSQRHGLRDGRTASRALGYQQVLRYLDGDWTLEQAGTRPSARPAGSPAARSPGSGATPGSTGAEVGDDLLHRALSLL